ncbi:MAG: GTPase HflX [Verrucomicrobiota bacterium]|nr:GTPase HflX [Verrucomicrobiota bacterium]
MYELHHVSPVPAERVLVVGLAYGNTEPWAVRESLDELAELAVAAGAQVIERAVQQLGHPTPSHFIGKGKAEELSKLCKNLEINVVVFDDDLTPAQGRNLSDLFKIKVIDRTELILDIFGQRARTREGKIQVELAQLQYLLPRLKRMWLHLSRQAGGIGGRGPGETQLEVDRRRIQEKISRLTRELEDVRKQRATQRGGRQRANIPVISLVGYTNAGKSTLMNQLTGANVLAVDQLFATLDPTTRQVKMPNHQKVLLSDTVGFIRKLPTHLVEAFKATLEEVQESDFLLHVVDSSHRQCLEQIEAVDNVLRQIESHQKSTLMVFNKCDLVEDRAVLGVLKDQYPRYVVISAKQGKGVDELIEIVQEMIKMWRRNITLKLPATEGSLVAEIHRIGKVLKSRYTAKSIFLEAQVPPEFAARMEKFVVHKEVKPKQTLD